MLYTPEEKKLTLIKGDGQTRGFFTEKITKKDLYTSFVGFYIDQINSSALPTTIIMPNENFAFVKPTKEDENLLISKIVRLRRKYLVFITKVDEILENLNTNTTEK